MPVLGTKLHLPTPRRQFVPRARLTDQLHDPRSTPRLVLVSAPAGYGKTTLEPAPHGALVTYDADLRLRGPLRLIDPALALAFRRIGDRAAAGLRAALDGVPA